MRHENKMRLPLVVHRHALPERKLMWNTEDNSTIFQLVSRVNEVVSLESDHFTLGHYEVGCYWDVNGTEYECLPFHNVVDILRRDDQVMQV